MALDEATRVTSDARFASVAALCAATVQAIQSAGGHVGRVCALLDDLRDPEMSRVFVGFSPVLRRLPGDRSPEPALIAGALSAEAPTELHGCDVSHWLSDELGWPAGATHLLVVPVYTGSAARIAMLVGSCGPLSSSERDLVEASAALLRLGAAPYLAHHPYASSEQRFRALIQHASDMFTITDQTGVIQYESPAVRRTLGYDPESLVGLDVYQLIHPEDVESVRAAGRAIRDNPDEVGAVVYRVRHMDGSWRWVESIIHNLLHDPAVAGIVVNSRDVSERKQAEEQLQAAETRYRLLVEQIPAAVYVETNDENNSTLYMSPQIEQLLGYTAEEWTEGARLWEQLLHPEDRDRVVAENARTNATGERFFAEYRHRTRDDRWVWLRDEAVLVRDERGEPLFWQGIKLDISEQKRLESELSHQALHDSLTGLPNRALFIDRLEHARARAARRPTRNAVLFLDLDDFKVVNDSLGHDVGDELLIAVGRRVRSCLRMADTIARIGGDEFTVLLEDLAAPDEANIVSERMTNALAEPFDVAGHTITISASIGIAIDDTGERSGAELLRNADMAMYAAKHAGHAERRVFDERMHQRAVERLRIESDLRRAIQRGEFEVHFQPIVRLSTGQPLEVEALVRWQHPERGLVSPLEFIPLAEETGLILPIGRWVMREACRQVVVWHTHGGTPLSLNVNLSARQFNQPELVGEIAAIIDETGMDPRHLMLEITESVAMVDVEATTSTMRELKALGVRFAIDDFGTGYSSLSYLKRFPVDALKIDRSFIGGLGAGGEDAAIVRSVIAVANALGLSVTAEGVETAEQVDELLRFGCDRGQGFYFSRPLSAGALLDQMFPIAEPA